ncbi:aminoglycoside phosphotransferase [Pseudoalteromonas citrea]|uniref:Aminoglycoside phosphotransferase n=1 Tax=Pseudoalteromonas citrea TaxID=43655 RepID=A0A5S3XVW2_9GAMM|nr:phosphotransferase [Pseudoalteromonas citrea]TMP43486.1 aminoglycoside phosphotransferase [Pseudoalteromonas citrea]TMP62115.1 aminoglycoside phosphotransferase [Pseudoalteromonas citrea]
MLNDSVITWLKITLGVKSIELTPINGGANNLGIKVSSGKHSWFLKSFNKQSPNVKYKQKNEFLFSQEVYKNSLTATPKPIAINLKESVSLFSFIEGRKIEKASKNAVQQSILFFQNINLQVPPRHLNIASESPSTLAEFGNIVSYRLKKLETVTIKSEQLSTDYHKVLTLIRQRQEKLTYNLAQHWYKEQQRSVLSPSDFGFHNAIEANASLYFIDFEYAGLDTPWKVFADFFSQPTVPVDLTFAVEFLKLEQFRSLIENPEDTVKVFELTQLKWCLIMLNEFLPEVQARRIHSWNVSCLDEQRKKLQIAQLTQLEKCYDYFESIPNKIVELDKLLRDLI